MKFFLNKPNLKKEAADLQKQVAANSISEEKAKTIYEKLMQKQTGTGGQKRPLYPTGSG